MRRRSYRMHGLGKLPAGCEIHVFHDKDGNLLTGKGSRKKVCRKRKVSKAAAKKWSENLKNACADKAKLPVGLYKACGYPLPKTAKKASKKKAA